MKHPWEHIIKAFAADTSVKIECRSPHFDSLWGECSISLVVNPCYASYEFRLKPAMRSITLADGTVVEWPEPMRVAPETGTHYFIAYPNRVTEMPWTDCNVDRELLKAGFCHLTEEAAQQHRKAIVLANGGEL